jgi:hypothetical protein
MKFQIRVDEEERAAEIEMGHFRARIERDLFRTLRDEDAKRRLFLNSVKRVNLEISSYCNRRCGFCPNRDGNRLSSQTFMPQAMFEKAVLDLESIGFSKPLYFHLYNEPLAAPEVLVERMAFARPRLAQSTFAITTNGDYLTQAMFERLEAAGCDKISVSVYGPSHGQWDDVYIKERVLEIATELDLREALIERPGWEYRISGTIGRIRIDVGGYNLWRLGYDRGGLIPELGVMRSSPCLAPISDVNIDFRGYMLPCCNVYTDDPKHLAYTFGNLSDADIFTLYAGAVAQEWRRSLLRFDPGGSLCSSCSRGNLPEFDTPANRSALNRLRQAMGIDEVK